MPAGPLRPKHVDINGDGVAENEMPDINVNDAFVTMRKR
jgi:hypothetical protein